MRLVAFFSTCCVACGGYANGGNPETLRDTTGAVFGWSCSDQGCKLGAVDGTPKLPACGGRAGDFFTMFRTRFVSLCVGSTDASLCRLAACDGDHECPVWSDTAYACVDGLCQSDPSRAMDADDVVDLCLARTAWPTDCGAEIDPALRTLETDTAMACMTSGRCSVPTACRQP